MTENKSHVVSGLIQKRREIAGRVEQAQSDLRQFLIDLDNIDAAIRIFAPDIDLEAVKPKPLPARSAAYKGEVVRIVLGALREAKAPLTALQLAEIVMTERGLNPNDLRMQRTVVKRVHACLRHHRRRDLIRSSTGPNRVLVWELVP